MNKTIAIIQARMGSQRLPGKIIKPFGDKNILEHIITALKQCTQVHKIYLATSTNPENKVLEPIAQQLGIPIYFGPEENVLERFHQVIQQEPECDRIVRVCADSPLIDPAETDELIAAHKQQNAHLSINYNHPAGLPCGIGVEVISRHALEESFRLAETDEHKEHLDEWVLQHPEKYIIYRHPVHPSKRSTRVHFTLDTPQDYRFLTAIKRQVQNGNAESLLKHLHRNPSLVEITKIFVRADGSGEIGMGHIMRSLTVCKAMQELFPAVQITYYTSPEALAKVQEHQYNAKLFDEEGFQRDVATENPNLILIDLRKHLDDVSSMPLNKALKVRFIDSERVQNVRGDVIINSYPLSSWPHPCYYAGLQYIPLRKEFSTLPPKKQKKNVQTITVSLGGGDQLGEEKPGSLILKIMSVLQEFPVQVNLVLGSAMNKETIENIKAQHFPNLSILQDVRDMPLLLYKTDLGISAGGNTLLEFSRCEVPTICVSLNYDHVHSDHQRYYCEAIAEAGASAYIGHADQWSTESFRRIVQELTTNYEKRKEMALAGRSLVNDKIRENIREIITSAYIGGIP